MKTASLPALLALFLVAAAIDGASAAGTDPTLALTGGSALVSPQGAYTVEVRGSFNFDDLLQFSFPAGVIVIQGQHFARYDAAGAIGAGDAAFVADGLVPAELEALRNSGSTAAAPAVLIRLEPSRIVVALPPGFNPGVATVVVYAVLENTSFLSNAVSVSLPQRDAR